MKYLQTTFIALALLLAGFGLYKATAQSPSFGAVNTNAATPAVFETYLANAEGTADTSLTLASGSLRDGSALSGYICLTIDSNTPSLEYECGTASGTTVSGLVRGIDAITGTTTVASLVYAHRRGADVKVTDYPTLTILNNELNGVQRIPNLLRYDDTVLVGAGSASTTLATKYYVDNTAVSGAPNATSLVKGIAQLATAAQAALGTILGSTGANLVLPSSIASSTPSAATPTGTIPTTVGQYLSQTWIDLTTAASWVFNGAVSIAASSSYKLTLNTVAYVFPSSQGAANTIPVNDGAGNISWGNQPWVLLTSTTTQQNMAYATTTFPAYNYLKITSYFAGLSTANDVALTFNSDRGINYGATRTATYNTASIGSPNNYTYISLNYSTTSPAFFNFDIYNATTTRKFVLWSGMYQAGSADAPYTDTGAGVWNNTSAQITQAILSMASAGTITAGTIIQVWGHN